MEKYCSFCFNARVSDDENLTDENDLSCCTIGNSVKGHQLVILSGAGKPLRIISEVWSEKDQAYKDVAMYFPKYCPNCGRKLSEYDL